MGFLALSRQVARHGRVLFASCLLLAAVVSGTALAQEDGAGEPAAESPGLVIMVVDFQGVIRQSAAAESIQQRVAVVQRGFQEKYRDLEVRLRGMERELGELRGTLSEEEFIVRRREFEREVTIQQREAQAERALLDEALNRSMGMVRATALEIIAQFADEAGASLVLNKADIILSDRDLDRTAEVLAELDRRLPSVEVDLDIADSTQPDAQQPNATEPESTND